MNTSHREAEADPEAVKRGINYSVLACEGLSPAEHDAVDHDQRDEQAQGLVHIRRICLHRELKDSDESSDDHDIYRDMDLVRNHRCDSGNHDVRQH